MFDKSKLVQYRTSICLNFLCLLNFGSPQAYRNKPQPTPYHDWDFLMFSQRWPLTACTEWEEAKSGNTCNLNPDRSIWTIHGIWPTKSGHEGPLFCPSSIHFNPDELTPMLNDLNNYWTNIEGGTKPTSFWAHEWNKHGTCASVLPNLNSVTNYFNMGLVMNKQYDLSKILSRGGIVPSSEGYDVSQIYSVVKNAINKEPAITCVTDRKTKESFLSEIRICLDKSLEPTDCDIANPIHRIRYGLNTNCNQKKPVQYIASIPATDVDYSDEKYVEYQEHYRKHIRYSSFYNLLKTLLWLTL